MGVKCTYQGQTPLNTLSLSVHTQASRLKFRSRPFGTLSPPSIVSLKWLWPLPGWREYLYTPKSRVANTPDEVEHLEEQVGTSMNIEELAVLCDVIGDEVSSIEEVAG